MVIRTVNLLVDKSVSRETFEKAYIGKNQKVDGIWYKPIAVTNFNEERDNETTLASLQLESIEGEELETILSAERKESKIPLLNIPACIRDFNEDFIDITAIIPLQKGEQFAKYLNNDLNIYECDIIYKEGYSDRVTFSRELGEWDFADYNWLVTTREETSCGYALGTYALKDLNNLHKCR